MFENDGHVKAVSDGNAVESAASSLRAIVGAGKMTKQTNKSNKLTNRFFRKPAEVIATVVDTSPMSRMLPFCGFGMGLGVGFGVGAGIGVGSGGVGKFA